MPIRHITWLFLVAMIFNACSDTNKTVASVGEKPAEMTKTKAAASVEASAKVKVYEDFAELEHIFHIQNDTTYLINFWATWCKPCVKELPLFERLLEDMKGEKYKSILISLDFPNKIESKLIPFIKENKLKSEVIVLTDGKQQEWIDKVDKEWDGAIPVTLVYKKENSKFLYGEVHDYDELKSTVEKIMKN